MLDWYMYSVLDNLYIQHIVLSPFVSPCNHTDETENREPFSMVMTLVNILQGVLLNWLYIILMTYCQ